MSVSSLEFVYWNYAAWLVALLGALAILFSRSPGQRP